MNEILIVVATWAVLYGLEQLLRRVLKRIG